MKKLLSLFLLLCLCIVASCAKPSVLPQPTRGVLIIDPEKYYATHVFALPEEDFRSAAVNHMRKQASIQWVCSGDFAVMETFKSWGINLSFQRGETYTGIPYADTKVSYTQFENALQDGKFTFSSTRWKDVYGVQCVSSIMNAVQQFAPNIAGWSTELMPGYPTFLGDIVGDYIVPQGHRRTKDILEANSQETMLAAYSQLQKGDIIITKDDIKDASHLRMLVEDPTVVLDASGKIDPAQSFVKTIEQTNQFDKTRTDGVKTTWYVDHTYTFEKLYATDYVPVTLDIYNQNPAECQLPFIVLDQEVDSAELLAGTTTSKVRSNFPIRHVTFTVYSPAGKQVKQVKAYDLANIYSVKLGEYGPSLVPGLGKGEYSLVLTAGIAVGDAELQRLSFTIGA